MLADGQRLVVRRAGDRAIDVGELAAAGLVPGPYARRNVLGAVGHEGSFRCQPAQQLGSAASAFPVSAIISALTERKLGIGPFQSDLMSSTTGERSARSARLRTGSVLWPVSFARLLSGRRLGFAARGLLALSVAAARGFSGFRWLLRFWAPHLSFRPAGSCGRSVSRSGRWPRHPRASPSVIAMPVMPARPVRPMRWM